LARAEEASKKEETGNLILAYMRVSETSNELARAEEASPVTKKEDQHRREELNGCSEERNGQLPCSNNRR